ncbi:MAG: hypothetical protein LBG60_08990 [Bifidobacteriaceae bacterium]|jgi:predicted nucleic acid-binding protein|nr:hypothetical protein [Bifidobacteriaceae bacterium]
MILIDTSVLLALPALELPAVEVALSTISLAELRFGIAVAATSGERASRMARLMSIERHAPQWLPFDAAAAEGYGTVAAAIWRQRPAHARSKDAMLAGHAYALGAGIATLNPRDFDLVAHLVPITRLGGSAA